MTPLPTIESLSNEARALVNASGHRDLLWPLYEKAHLRSPEMLRGLIDICGVLVEAQLKELEANNAHTN